MTNPFAILALALVGFVLAGGLVLLVFGNGLTRARAFVDTLHTKQPLPLRAFGLVAGLWVILFGHVIVTLFGLWYAPPDTKAEGGPLAFRLHFLAIVGMLGALAGLVGFPFALIRVATTERQTKAAEDQRDHNDLVQVNARLQSALEQLSARYSETRMGRNVTVKKGETTDTLLDWQDDPLDRDTFDSFAPEPWQAFTFDAPDRQTRLAGIGQFAAIAAERPEVRRRINEHLATFLRANAPAETAEDPPAPRSPEMSLIDHAENLRTWVASLRPLPDIQAAISLLGASLEEADLKDLDLRRINLQGAELNGLSLKACQLTEARLERANLWGAHLEGAYLGRAHLEGADIRGAHLEGADLGGAHLEGAYFSQAHMEGARLLGAHLEGAELGGAHLEGANFLLAHLEEANLGGADLERATLMGAKLNGADFWLTNLEGADLRQAPLDSCARFNPLSLRGAGLRAINLKAIPNLHVDLSESFGDGSVNDHRLTPEASPGGM